MINISEISENKIELKQYTSETPLGLYSYLSEKKFFRTLIYEEGHKKATREEILKEGLYVFRFKPDFVEVIDLSGISIDALIRIERAVTEKGGMNIKELEQDCISPNDITSKRKYTIDNILIPNSLVRITNDSKRYVLSRTRKGLYIAEKEK